MLVLAVAVLRALGTGLRPVGGCRGRLKVSWPAPVRKLTPPANMHATSYWLRASCPCQAWQVRRWSIDRVPDEPTTSDDTVAACATLPAARHLCYETSVSGCIWCNPGGIWTLLAPSCYLCCACSCGGRCCVPSVFQTMNLPQSAAGQGRYGCRTAAR